MRLEWSASYRDFQNLKKEWNKPEKAEKLNALAVKHKSITVVQLDVTDHARIEALAAQYKDQPIDILINNAAMTPKYKTAFNPLEMIDFDIALKSLQVNAIGPLKMCQAFMNNVAA